MARLLHGASHCSRLWPSSLCVRWATTSRPRKNCSHLRKFSVSKDIPSIKSTRVVVEDAPFPLRLIYTFRSPRVALSSTANGGEKAWPLSLLFGANLLVYSQWIWVPPGQDPELLKRADETYDGVMNWRPDQTELVDDHRDFMQRNFTASVENLNEGRLHVLVTSGFSQADFRHLTGNMFALFLFGHRSCTALGPAAFLGLYIAGAFVCSSAHVMHNLYHGRTAPRLTQAELRGALRNALRGIDYTAQREDERGRKLQWISLWKSSSSHYGSHYFLSDVGPTNSAGVKNSDAISKERSTAGSSISLASKIGRLMTRLGMHAVTLARGYNVPTDNFGGRLQMTEASAGSETLSRRPTEVAKEEQFNQRLKQLEREARAEEAIRRHGEEVEATMNDEGEEEPRSLWKALKEQRRRQLLKVAEMEERRRAALLKVAKDLVFQCYVSTRDMPSHGASGAIMAITNGSVLLFPRDLVVQGGVNIPIPIAAAMYTFSDLIGIVYPHPVDPVDHVGHLAGAGTGLLYVWTRWRLHHGSSALPIVARLREILKGRVG